MILIRKKWIPDYLQESFTFVMVISMYAIADSIQSESGLLVVTMMGIVLANQQLVTIRHIVSFKENITVLLLSSLFVLLAARMEMSELLLGIKLNSILFIASLIFIIRPISVYFFYNWDTVSIQRKILFSMPLSQRDCCGCSCIVICNSINRSWV